MMKSTTTFMMLLLVLFLVSCEEQLTNELTDGDTYVDENGVSYSVVELSANANLCSAIELVQDNTVLDITTSIYDIDCDIKILNKSNIIIEGNNAVFNYTGNARFEIDSSAAITIRDLNIRNNKKMSRPSASGRDRYGRIEAFMSDNITLSNIQMKEQKRFPNDLHEKFHQIYFSQTSNSLITNNHIDPSEGELIVLEACTNTVVSYNHLQRGWSGVGTLGIQNDTLTSSDDINGYDNKIIGNDVANSQGAFLTINDRNALVADNYIYSDTALTHGPGIRFGHIGTHTHASNGIARNNTIKNLTNPGAAYKSSGIQIDFSQTPESSNRYTDLIIDGNKIIDCNDGIIISNQRGQFALIKNNEVTSLVGPALTIYSPLGDEQQSVLASSNTLISNGTTVLVRNASLVLQDNNITSYATADTSHAVYYTQADPLENEVIIQNNIINLGVGDASGIFHDDFYRMSGALIIGNTIKNGKYGIYLRGDDNLIKDNIIRDSNSRSILVGYGALNVTVSGNHTYHANGASVELWNTNGSSVFGNKFNYTGVATPSGYAVYHNSNDSTAIANIFDNILNKYDTESN